MGTLGNQPARNFRERDYWADALDLIDTANRTGVSLDQMIEIAKVAEMRRANNLAASDGDFRDEHAAGYGDCLNGIRDALVELAAAVSDRGAS